MDAIMDVLGGIIDTITGLIGGGAEGGIELGGILDTIIDFVTGLIGGGAA